MNTDKIDRKIIEYLKEDSRKSSEAIAEKLMNDKIVDKITRQTVHSRITALNNNKIIRKYTIIADEIGLGKEVTAIILVILDRAASVWKFTAEKLWNQREELEIDVMYHLAGEYDVMIKMKTSNISTLETNLATITSIKGVQRTHTMICLSGYEYGMQL
jgi:DNA-binding Lrp family transcriptional regulator